MSFVGDHEDSPARDDDAAFREYVVARGSAMLGIAVMLTGNRADAEDLVQAALASTYVAWHKINDHAALDAYVRRAMINTHISWWRRRKLDEFPTDEVPDQVVADHARDSDLAEVVRHALDRGHAQVLRGHDRAGDRRPARRQPGHGEKHRFSCGRPAAH